MKFNLKIIGITIAILLFLVPAAFGQIKGIFDEIGDIPEKHTLDVVILEEFLNFTCPHCNNFRKFSKPLFKKYGARLKKINIPITLSYVGSDWDGPKRKNRICECSTAIGRHDHLIAITNPQTLQRQTQRTQARTHPHCMPYPCFLAEGFFQFFQSRSTGPVPTPDHFCNRLHFFFTKGEAIVRNIW